MITNDKLKWQNGGFTLIEILISIGICGVVVTGVASMNTWLSSSVAKEAAKVDREIENTEMLKLVTQPVYFGALKEFPENIQLQQCMTVDKIDCDTTKEYPFFSFNLSTKLPLKFASISDTATNISNELSFRVHCPNNATSCDRASYFTVTAKTYLNYLNFKTAVIEKRGIVSPDFTNIVTFVPDSTVANGRPVNVVIFLDNSNSMIFAKDQIKVALDDLIIKLSNMNVTVGIYSLATVINTAWSQYYIDGSGNQVSPIPNPIPPGFVYYSQMIDNTYWMDTSSTSTFDPVSYIGSPYSINHIFPFIPNEDATLHANKVQSLRNLIDSYFNVPNIDNDTPLCTMLKFLEMPGTKAPFVFDQFTPTVFMVITNEDDQTDFSIPWHQANKCKKGKLTEFKQSDNMYTYNGKVQLRNLRVTANVTIDGAPGTYTIGVASPILPYNPSYASLADCSADLPLMSQSEIESLVAKYFKTFLPNIIYTIGAGYSIESCRTFNQTHKLGLNYPSPQPICENVTNGQLQVPINYVTNSCRETLFNQSVGTTQIEYDIIPGISDPIEATYQSLKNHVNLSNFFYMPIVHTDATTCPMTTGSSVGTRYLALGNKTGINSKPTPICSPDYSAQLSQMDTWITSFASNDIKLTAVVAANLNAVELLRNGTTILLTANVDYSLTGTTLVFKPGVLLPNDVIRVYLK
ncbi:type IV pilus modification PilV family protein [Bdellovibrio svalbardensis]|uniref:Prepilin-type N-terminal cleavage/methylation domain-containing protein n=1 Tax=Bdellovibrio svalbardensis TaxID=2972972 RepID=A0ABT6DKB9_9BACT|nr:prepilin-type N-terminal cleavage/methylation domain-containing protein [Bdellovibrio svalbardensis]MDG0815553.1 prepilin-type N-terminal cleavage/methylation domain-containing protein [Bdellovibrio svalbardensis]